MRAIGQREGSTSGGGRGRLALAAAATVVAATALVLAARGDGDDPAAGIVRVEAAAPLPAATMTVAPAPVGARMVYELHGVSAGGPRPSALLAPHGAPPRSFAVGETIGPGVVLETVARGHILLREGTALVRIDLPPRLGGSGEPVAPAERGLRPEPRPPTGELSGARIALPGGTTPAPLPGDDPTTAN